MTTFVQFSPRPRAAFRFQPVLDGAAVQAVCTWSFFGRRWYVSVYTLTGERVLTLPIVGSSDPVAVDSAAWDGTRQRVVATTVAPHGVRVGTIASLTFRGFSPAGFNGVAVDCVALDPTTLAYYAPDDPGGVAVVCGSVASEVDLAAGYFTTSTLIFRTSSNRFEIEP